MDSTSFVTASIVLVGCGCPLKSMGWYHAEQLIAGRCPSAKLKIIVEPFYMNPNTNKDVPGYIEFHNWKQKHENSGIDFYDTVEKVPLPVNNEIRIMIISARTADNPSLFDSCINVGCHAIFLEKPGAPTVTELEQMKIKADIANIQVYMGFNKNVSSYVSHTLEFAKQQSSCDIIFLHNNSYQPNELSECFERNSEGILKNMAIHELALLITYFDVNVDTIDSVIADVEYSSCQSLVGPSTGKTYIDFDKLKFKILTKSAIEVSIAADRCGGDDSVGIVIDSVTHNELVRFSMPDQQTIENISKLYPNAMPYFYMQDPDYSELKERVAKACITQQSKPNGVATIETAIEALKLAEYLTPILQKQLS